MNEVMPSSHSLIILKKVLALGELVHGACSGAARLVGEEIYFNFPHISRKFLSPFRTTHNLSLTNERGGFSFYVDFLRLIILPAIFRKYDSK
jgi:hypothetical protein